METTTVGSTVAKDTIKTFANAVEHAQGVYNDLLRVGLEQAQKNYMQTQQAYARELQDLFSELSNRSQQVYRAYGESLNVAIAASPSYEQCVAEYRGYLERLQQLLAGTEVVQRTQLAYDAYMDKLKAQPNEATARDATGALYQELDTIWKQEPLRQEVQAAQGRYLALIERLSGEVLERQSQAHRDLLAALGDIWSQPDIDSRTHGALARLIGGVRDVLVECHAAIEKGSSKAIEAMAGSVP